MTSVRALVRALLELRLIVPHIPSGLVVFILITLKRADSGFLVLRDLSLLDSLVAHVHKAMSGFPPVRSIAVGQLPLPQRDLTGLTMDHPLYAW